MKKKLTLFISMIMALTMAFSLTACKDDTGSGGPSGPSGPGGNGDVSPVTSVTTLEDAREYFANLPQGDNVAEVDEILKDAFGVDLTFPTADRVYSYDGDVEMNGVSYKNYNVKIDGTTLTGEDFYNSIKTTMTASGFECDDETLTYGKVIGDLVYAFEIVGRNGWVVIEIDAYEYIPPATSKYTLPENLKVVYEDEGINITAIKIGNNYYSEYSYYGNIVTMKYYSHYDEATGMWTLYDWTYGAADWGYNYYMGDERYTTSSATIVGYYAFMFMVDYTEISIDYEASGTTTLLGRTVNKFVSVESTAETPREYYADAQTGLVLKRVSGNKTSEVTLFDTTVTSFDGVTLPTIE